MNAQSMDQIHASVAPCKDWGTPHICYACSSASHSLGSTNDIAVALESLGIKCHIDQTGGMTMVGVVTLKSGITCTWNDEVLVKSPVHYEHEDFEYDGEVLLTAERVGYQLEDSDESLANLTVSEFHPLLTREWTNQVVALLLSMNRGE